MSHFTVTVCLSAEEMKAGLDQALDAKLAPFDENTEVEPYRAYEEGPPGEFWWVKSVRRGAESEQAEDVRWTERLGENPDWATVVALYNEAYPDGQRLAVEDGRAYEWSRYNPLSKWDWWTVGGRWQRHFVSVPLADSELLVFGAPGAGGDNGRPRSTDDSAFYCDGGPVELLDFARMRDEAAVKQLARYDRWHALVIEHGIPEPWERLRSLAEIGEITWDVARSRYNNQPVVKATRAGPDPLVGFLCDPAEEQFGTTREEFERRARASAVPGYALLTLAGEWTAPGHMGWFGMSSDGPGERDSFAVAASKYLDELPRDTWVVQVDCHI